MISIIIPIYNVAPYLERCFDSILNQTYQDFEVILVDDGSTDNSRDVCQKYVERDQRFTYHYKKNGGVSSARNLGLQMVKGEFVYMMDPDDSIQENCLEWHLEKLTDDVDVSISSHHLIDESGREIDYSSQWRDWNKKWKPKEAVELALLRPMSFIIGILWQCLFRFSIICNNKLSFDEDLSYSEDILFCMKYYSCCKKLIYFENIPLYNYYRRFGSLANPGKNKIFFGYVNDFLASARMCKFLRENKLDLKLVLLAKVHLFYKRQEKLQYLSEFPMGDERRKYEAMINAWYAESLSGFDRSLLYVYDWLKRMLKI